MAKHYDWERPRGAGSTFAANRHRILPQLMPALPRTDQSPGGKIVTLPFAAGLHIAFVLDESDRYLFITEDYTARWRVRTADLLVRALNNLHRLPIEARWKQVGADRRAIFLCETFDGYDASRILLPAVMADVAGRIQGNLLVGMPQRDYLVALGDRDPALVKEVRQLVQHDFACGRYPVSPRIFSLVNGVVRPYGRQRRVVH